MELLNTILWAAFKAIVPFAAVFIGLALVVKRREAIAAFRRCAKEARTNFSLWFINGLIFGPLFAIPVISVELFFEEMRLIRDGWEILPSAVTVILAVVVIDFTAYWRHRLEHSPELWRFHATHHADSQMHWLTLLRKHPIGQFLSLMLDGALAIWLGFPAWAIIAAGVIRVSWGYFIHSDVPWTLGLLSKVLISPAAHRLHHIRDEELMGNNFGNTICLWDQLFGTYRDPAAHINCETGIKEGTRGFWGELKRPFEKRYRRADQPFAQNQNPKQEELSAQ